MMSCLFCKFDGMVRRSLAGACGVICVLALFSLGAIGPVRAQQEADRKAGAAQEPAAADAETGAKKAAEATAKKEEEAKRARALALAEALATSSELTAAQIANFEKWVPHSYARLRERQAVHIVVIGDSVTRYKSYDEHQNDSHFAYHGIFAAKLADEFFYTGGVRDVLPMTGNPAKAEPLLGPELTLENLGMNGRVSLHALSRLTADALVNRPDLVMINFGINDAYVNLSLATYVEALERSVELVKRTGADVILLGPSTTIGGKSIDELALTRPYAGAMEELAARLGVFFFDLGSVTTAAPGTPEGTDPGVAMEEIRLAYLRHFDHGTGVLDTIHPSPATHKRMGEALFEALRDGGPEPAYRLNGLFTLNGQGEGSLEFKIKNLRDVAVKGQVYLVPVEGMAPQSKTLAFQLAAGKGKVYTVDYGVSAGSSGAYDFPAYSPQIFVPMVVTDPVQTSSRVFAVPLAPLGVVWDTGAQDLSGRGFEVRCELVGSGTKPASGSYEALWNGQGVKGDYRVAPGEKQSLVLAFDVPSGDEVFRVRDDLVLSLEAGGKKLQFVRRIEASRNLGLGESVDLMRPARYSEGERETDGRVRFMAEATPSQLVLNFDVGGIELHDAEGVSALMLEFQLDARGFGKRRKFGYVDSVRVRFGKDGVAERLSALRPSVFGDWYDRALDRTQLGAARTPLPDGRERYSITVPRSYLYLHEFALGNGNSVFGVNANLRFAKAGEAGDPYPEDQHYALVDSGLNLHSAESLTVLELADKSTGRWSVRIR